MREKQLMTEHKFAFKKATQADKKLVHQWLELPHVKEYWDGSKEIAKHFEDPFFNFWICFCDEEPFGLVVTSDASHPDPATKEVLDHIVPWLDPEGKTLLIDFAITEKDYLDKGLASETLHKFAQAQEPSVKAFLADPEAKNAKALHVYEMAGFVKVSTFIRGKGFFKGKPHYLLKLKILH
jgi:RimJ/RimL family protein N-acetyltransferase